MNEIYETLVKKSFPTGNIDESIDLIGQLIDASGELDLQEGITLAFEWSDIISKMPISDSQFALLNYFIANAWAVRQAELKKSDSWNWYLPEVEKEIYFLRCSINGSGYAKLSANRRCQIFSNLGNLLNVVGRFVDALELWDQALELSPQYGMALGNKGYGLFYAAQILFDEENSFSYYKHAYNVLGLALENKAKYDNPLYSNAVSAFKEVRNQISAHIRIDLTDETEIPDNDKLGKTIKERTYRTWCLENRLFLNVLNDLGYHTTAAHDPLTLPNLSSSFTLSKPPSAIGFFNQLKQEFVSARWLLFQGIYYSDSSHFSDRNVTLYDTYEFPVYGLQTENLKKAYSSAYSIFDKIGYFINDYLDLKINQKKVNFRALWYKPEGKGTERFTILRDEFENSNNWALRGLFWLSKDLFDEKLRDVTSPDAKDLQEIRNHIEHKYLKLHDSLAPDLTCLDSSDDIGYSLRRDEFEVKTVRLFKLVRAALIYLSLSVHKEEESRRQSESANELLTVPIFLKKL